MVMVSVPSTLDVRPWRSGHLGQIHDFRLAGGVFLVTVRPWPGCSHQYIFRYGDGNRIKEENAHPQQAAFRRTAPHDVALFHGDLGAHASRTAM